MTFRLRSVSHWPHGRSIRLLAVTRSHRLVADGEFTYLWDSGVRKYTIRSIACRFELANRWWCERQLSEITVNFIGH
jgi:hypothetical protein